MFVLINQAVTDNIPLRDVICITYQFFAKSLAIEDVRHVGLLS